MPMVGMANGTIGPWMVSRQRRRARGQHATTARDEIQGPRCRLCGGPIETPWKDVCYGCYLAGLVPAGYERRERYEPDPFWTWPDGTPIQNATRKPLTGLAILDARSAARLCDLLPAGRRSDEQGR